MVINKYDYVAEDIKKKIYSGEIKPGDRLESENVLTQKYGVSRQTIRKAMERLMQDGIVETVRGKGAFCKELPSKVKRTKNIAVVITYINDYIFPLILKGIYDVLDRQKYSIILKSTNNGRDAERECLKDILSKDIDGLIIEPSKSEISWKNIDLIRKFDARGIPYVFIQGKYIRMKDKPHVTIDDEGGTRMLTKYLIDKGHRNIAGIFEADITQGVARHRGYAKTLQENGFFYNPDNVIWFHVEDRFAKTDWAVENMIRNDPTIDAIVCYNDMIAYKVIEVLGNMGIRVPEDISVTGFDAQAQEETGAFKLTTVKHPKERLGERAAQTILELIDGKEPEIMDYVFKLEFVEGVSCKERKYDR